MQAFKTLFGYIFLCLFVSTQWLGLFLLIRDNWEWHVVQEYETASLTPAAIITLMVLFRLFKPFNLTEIGKPLPPLGDRIERALYASGIMGILYGVTFAAHTWM